MAYFYEPYRYRYPLYGYEPAYTYRLAAEL